MDYIAAAVVRCPMVDGQQVSRRRKGDAVERRELLFLADCIFCVAKSAPNVSGYEGRDSCKACCQ